VDGAASSTALGFHWTGWGEPRHLSEDSSNVTAELYSSGETPMQRPTEAEGSQELATRSLSQGVLSYLIFNFKYSYLPLGLLRSVFLSEFCTNILSHGCPSPLPYQPDWSDYRLVKITDCDTHHYASLSPALTLSLPISSDTFSILSQTKLHIDTQQQAKRNWTKREFSGGTKLHPFKSPGFPLNFSEYYASAPLNRCRRFGAMFLLHLTRRNTSGNKFCCL
jgi:hypothetical protein